MALTYSFETASERLAQLKNFLDAKEAPKDIFNERYLPQIFDDFQAIFNSELFRDYPHTYSQKFAQLNAVWLYLAFSQYVHHWKNDASISPAIKAQLETIYECDRQVIPSIAQALRNINQAYVQDLPHDRNYHQKLLMIQGNLFNYFSTLAKNNPDQLDFILRTLPLSLARHVLENAANIAQTRLGGASHHTETHVFHALREITPPDYFHFLKATPDACHIDPFTGLELDCPLNNFITIETDGPHHYYSDSHRHHLVHTFKSSLLREYGWSRVPITLDNPSEQARNISHLLQLEPVKAFAEIYNQVICKHAEIINAIQQSTSLEEIQRLLSLEYKFREFKKRQLLEKALDCTHPSPGRLKAIESYRQYMDVLANKPDTFELNMNRELMHRALEEVASLEKEFAKVESDIRKARESISKHKQNERNFFKAGDYANAEKARKYVSEKISEVHRLESQKLAPVTQRLGVKRLELAEYARLVHGMEAREREYTINHERAFAKYEQDTLGYFRLKLPIHQAQALLDSCHRPEEMMEVRQDIPAVRFSETNQKKRLLEVAVGVKVEVEVEEEPAAKRVCRAV